jgi:hypothetical protein
MSALIVCLVCDRQHYVVDPYHINICSNCGVREPYIVRDHRIYEDWSDKDGIPKIEAQRRTYAGLKWLCNIKGHKPGYPLAKFRDIFGCWPPREIEDVPAEAPTVGLIRKIAVSNASWKKQKRAEEQANKPVIAKITHPVDYAPSWMTDEDWTVKL